jgi:electron-transferring-flavoprotein dehydrogenase
MEYDAVCVGAGPAGLSAAIRLKQLNPDMSVCVLEKGSEVGAHILSGNVFETRALDELIPDWKEKVGNHFLTRLPRRMSVLSSVFVSHAQGAPVDTPVKEDAFHYLTESHSAQIPNALLPPQLHNEGNYIISLSQLVRWLGEQAEELGVEIYPGFAASEVLYSDDGKTVLGVATRDVGIGKDGKAKGSFERGIELRAKQTLFSEGARGSCSESIMEHFGLRHEGVDVQTYGLGVKEVWEVPEEQHNAGFVQHTLGWPLQNQPLDKTFGGSFLYHMKPNLVLVGFVVGLDYENPHLNPYAEFQRWKHHPVVSKHLEGGRCISYGARALNEGGYHAIPKLTFPGGAMIGCSAGFLNSVKIKGSHTAIKSGMVAAEAVHELLEAQEKDDEGVTTEAAAVGEANEAVAYQSNMEKSWVYEELKEVRNVHAAFHWGMLPGLAYAAVSAFILKGREPWTLRNTVEDHAKTKPASECTPIVYPKPDGVLSFDLLTNLTRSGTNHENDQPAHLTVKEGMEGDASGVSLPTFAGPEQRFCPAGVYSYTEATDEEPGGQLAISAQNCLHCKTCDIKTPKGYIRWTVPEGGGGPAYTDC